MIHFLVLLGPPHRTKERCLTTNRTTSSILLVLNHTLLSSYSNNICSWYDIASPTRWLTQL